MAISEIDRATGLKTSAAYKAPVYVATTANITLAGEQTIDGLVTDESRVLVKNQTDQAENGIYLTSTGDWQRAPDFSRNEQIAEGTRVWVTDGSTNGALEFVIISPDPISIDSADIVWQRSVDLTPSADYGTALHNSPNKATPVDADEFGIWDSVTTALAKVTFANLKATMFAALGPYVVGLTSKATPADADALLLADTAASNVPKRLTWANLVTNIVNGLGVRIAALTPKTTPVDADGFLISDSAASSVSKFLSWANIKATLKNYFDTLYAATGTTGLTLLTEQATTSGTTKDFTIPSGAKRVTVGFNNVSHAGPSVLTLGIQLGDSGGVETTGYLSSAGNSPGLGGSFLLTPTASAPDENNEASGVLTLMRINSSHLWVMGGALGLHGGSNSQGVACGGTKTLSAELTTVRVTAGGTFDSGSVNVMYEL